MYSFYLSKLCGLLLASRIISLHYISTILFQDYIKESDNLVSLHDQIRDCDNILSQMETLLSGFQVVCLLLGCSLSFASYYWDVSFLIKFNDLCMTSYISMISTFKCLTYRIPNFISILLV